MVVEVLSVLSAPPNAINAPTTSAVHLTDSLNRATAQSEHEV